MIKLPPTLSINPRDESLSSVKKIVRGSEITLKIRKEKWHIETRLEFEKPIVEIEKA